MVTKWLPLTFSIFDCFYSYFSWSGNMNVKYYAWLISITKKVFVSIFLMERPYYTLKDFFNKHGHNFDDVGKKASLDLLKRKVLWNKDFEVIISVHDVTIKILSHNSNYIVVVVMWRKVGKYNISMREVVITSIF